MTLRECYQSLEGNYDEAMGRLRMEKLVRKFALKFCNDQSFDELTQFMQEGNTEEAFRAAHTLKGVAANLSFTRLADSASQMTELLRAGDMADAQALLPAVQQDYERTIHALQSLDPE